MNNKHTHTHTHTHIHTHTHTHTHTHMHAHPHTYTHRNTRRNTHTQTAKHAQSQRAAVSSWLGPRRAPHNTDWNRLGVISGKNKRQTAPPSEGYRDDRGCIQEHSPPTSSQTHQRTNKHRSITHTSAQAHQGKYTPRKIHTDTKKQCTFGSS